MIHPKDVIDHTDKKVIFNVVIKLSLRQSFWYAIILLMISIAVVYAFYFSKSPYELFSERVDDLIINTNAELEYFVGKDERQGILTPDFPFPLHVYDNGVLTFWSSSEYVPSYTSVHKRDSIFLYEDEYSTYLILHKQRATGSRKLREYFVFIPLYRGYPIENQYLSTGFLKQITEGLTCKFSSEGRSINIGSSSITILIEKVSSASFVIFLLEFGFLFLLIVILAGLAGHLRSRSQHIRLFSLLAFIWVIRFVELAFFPLHSFLSHYFFNPLLFTWSWWLPSAADLFINVTLFTLTVFFVFRYLTEHFSFSKLLASSGLIPVLFSLLVPLLATLNFLMFHQIIYLIISNSQIDLDVSSNIVLNAEKLFFYAILLIFTAGFLLLNQLFFTLFISLNKALRWISFLTLVSLNVAFYFVFDFSIVILSFLMMLLWALVYVSKSELKFRSFKYHSMYLVLYHALVVAVIIALLLADYHKEMEVASKQRYGYRLLLGTDILAEFNINQLLNKIQEDPYIRTRFMSDVLPKVLIPDKISRLMPIYLNKYYLDVHIFDQRGQPIINKEKLSYFLWESNYQKASYQTSYPNIYYMKAPETGRNKFFAYCTITQFDQPVGYLVLEFTLKRQSNTAVFPSVLQEQAPFVGGREYAYAHYKKGILAYSEGSYSFESKYELHVLDEISTLQDGFMYNDHHLLVLNAGDEGHYILVSPEYHWTNILTNTSFYFTIILLVNLMIFFLLPYDPTVPFSLANRLVVYLAIAFVIPILIISLAILNLLNQSNNEEIERSYSKQVNGIADVILPTTQQYFTNEINRVDFNYSLIQTASVIQSDILLYSPAGKLITTNRPEVIDYQLFGSNINPKALRFIKSNAGQAVVFDEKISTFGYKCAYIGLYAQDSSELLAILGMPFFQTKGYQHRQRTEILNNLLSVFFITFIISLVIGQVGFKKITAPIRMLSSRFNSLNYLAEANDPIQYGFNDEIGALVNQYNRMQEKLNESRMELSAMQKEAAWKEIAKQVAHEIKNPLTPMKLKVQQLQRNVQAETREYNVLQSLLVQIDTLATIADSFSAFTKMPAPKNNRFDLSKLVRNILAFFKDDDINIHEDISQEIFVYADEQIISQILNNLVLNALQSMEGRQKILQIKLEIVGKKCQLSIQDFGVGISAENHELIFKPYFSTKQKGSGIGLALAKKGIEQAGGSIWFESIEGEGTTFYVTFPMV